MKPTSSAASRCALAAMIVLAGTFASGCGESSGDPKDFAATDTSHMVKSEDAKPATTVDKGGRRK